MYRLFIVVLISLLSLTAYSDETSTRLASDFYKACYMDKALDGAGVFDGCEGCEKAFIIKGFKETSKHSAVFFTRRGECGIFIEGLKDEKLEANFINAMEVFLKYKPAKFSENIPKDGGGETSYITGNFDAMKGRNVINISKRAFSRDGFMVSTQNLGVENPVEVYGSSPNSDKTWKQGEDAQGMPYIYRRLSPMPNEARIMYRWGSFNLVFIPDDMARFIVQGTGKGLPLNDPEIKPEWTFGMLRKSSIDNIAMQEMIMISRKQFTSYKLSPHKFSIKITDGSMKRLLESKKLSFLSIYDNGEKVVVNFPLDGIKEAYSTAFSNIQAKSVPQIFTAVYDTNPSQLRTLLKNGANINQAFDGYTPLSLAIKEYTGTPYEDQIIDELLRSGADVNQGTLNDVSLTEYALIKAGYSQLWEKMFSKLVKKGGNAKDGSSPLHMAVKTGEIGFMNIAVKYFPQMNYADINGKTPLHIAAENNDISAVMFLVKNGATPQVHDKKGYTPSSMTSDQWIKDYLGGYDKFIFCVENNSELNARVYFRYFDERMQKVDRYYDIKPGEDAVVMSKHNEFYYRADALDKEGISWEGSMQFSNTGKAKERTGYAKVTIPKEDLGKKACSELK